MASLLSASLISTASGLGSLVFGFASNVIIARMLGAHGTGLVAFAIWIATAATIIAGLGVPNILLRYMGANDDPDRPGGGLARALLPRFTLPTLAVACGMLVWSGWQWADGDIEMAGIWAAAVVFYLAYAYAAMALGAARGRSDFAASARSIFYGCLGQVPLVALGCYFLGAGGALLGQAARHLPLALSLKGYVSGPRPAPGLVTPAMQTFGRNTWLSSMIGMLVWTRVEFLFLGLAHETVDIGFFAVGMTLAGLVVQLPEQMSGGLVPHFGRHHDRNDVAQLVRSYQRVFRWVGLTILPICFGGAAIMSELLPLLFGETFVPAVPIATVLVAGAFTTAFSIVPSILIGARERSDFFLWASPTLAVAMIVLLAVVVPYGGAFGAAWVRAGVHAAWLVWLVWYCWRRLLVPMPLQDLVKIGACSILCGAVALLVLQQQQGLSGLILAVAAGALSYAVCLRLVRAIPAGDVETLSDNLGSVLPSRLARLAIRLLLIIAPTGADRVGN